MPPCTIECLEWLNYCRCTVSATASIASKSSTPITAIRNISPSSATTTATDSSKFISSDYVVLLVGTVSGGLVLICITISLCFWTRKRLDMRRRQRAIARLRRQDSLRNRRSRWHNNSEEQLASKSFNEKETFELEERDTGLPLMPEHVFKFEDMPKQTDPFIDCIVDSPYDMPKPNVSKPAGANLKRFSTHSKKFGRGWAKPASIKSAIIEEDLLPAPLEPKRQQPSIPPPSSAKLAPKKSHSSSRPSLTALPPLNTALDSPMQQKEINVSPITGELLPARAFSRNRRNPIRKSLIPIYFMGKPSEESTGQPSKRGTLLSQSAAKFHGVLFGSRHGGARASASCRRSEASSVYTAIESVDSTDSVYGSLLPDSRRASHSRGKSTRFPVRPALSPLPQNSGPAESNGHAAAANYNAGGYTNVKSNVERLARISHASRSSEALPNPLRVRFKTPNGKRKKGPKRSAYHSNALLASYHADASMPPPVPPKTTMQTTKTINNLAARQSKSAGQARSNPKNAQGLAGAQGSHRQAGNIQTDNAEAGNTQVKGKQIKLQHDADGRPYEQHEDFRIDFI